jgi:hypothetical protein
LREGNAFWGEGSADGAPLHPKFAEGSPFEHLPPPIAFCARAASTARRSI